MSHSFAEIRWTLPMVGVVTMPHEGDTSVELLFDSFCQLTSRGMRSDTVGQRQMLYRADPYQIDLQLEADREHNRLIITGQLLDVTDPEMLGSDVQVTLSNLSGEVVKTATNQFGEFRGEVEDSGNVELTFLGRNEKPIIVLLRDVLQ